MSSTNHAPTLSGYSLDEWRLVDHGKYIAICAGDSNGTRVICKLQTCWDEEGNAEQRANAVLIMTAPRLQRSNTALQEQNTMLREALMSMVDMLAITYQSRSQEPPVMLAARAALKAAKGESC